jgi:DNA-directed RNA polymerase specialized sigma24 family protein
VEEIGSVSILLANLRDGDCQALTPLVARYWHLFVDKARKCLKHHKADVDCAAEEVANEALYGFICSLQGGRIPVLEHREQFLALMGTIVCRKAIHRLEFEGRQRRGMGWTKAGGAPEDFSDEREPDPSEIAAFNDTYDLFMQSLPDAGHLRTVAELHLSGASNREIATELNVAERTVERKLNRIRLLWQPLARKEFEGIPDGNGERH